MLTLTTVSIQEAPALRAVNADKGIKKETFSSDRVLLSDEVHDAIRAKMTEALEDYMVQIADPASYEDDILPEELAKVDFDHVLASMQANIDTFKLDAGGGYTATHKAALIGTPTGTNDEDGNAYVIEAIDFIAPKNRGVTTATGTAKKGGSMSL